MSFAVFKAKLFRLSNIDFYQITKTGVTSPEILGKEIWDGFFNLGN